MLYRNAGDGDGYVSVSEDEWHLSPIYLIAAAARRLMQDGRNVDLPSGYDTDTLDRITDLTGWYGERVTVSARQAGEVAQIARALKESYWLRLTQVERSAITSLVDLVTEAS